MTMMVLYRDYGRGEGYSEPLAIIGPWHTETDALEFYTVNLPRLKRLYSSDYSDLNYVLLEADKDIDLSIRAREGDKVLVNDSSTRFNGHFGTIDVINQELGVACVIFNKERVILKLDILEIQI